eukprot:1659173-Rhodomonas_salina.2
MLDRATDAFAFPGAIEQWGEKSGAQQEPRIRMQAGKQTRQPEKGGRGRRTSYCLAGNVIKWRSCADRALCAARQNWNFMHAHAAHVPPQSTPVSS